MSAIQLIRHAESEGNAGLPTHFIKALGLRQEQRQAPVDERLMAVFRETRRCDPLPNTGRKNIEFCQAKSGFFSR